MSDEDSKSLRIDNVLAGKTDSSPLILEAESRKCPVFANNGDVKFVGIW